MPTVSDGPPTPVAHRLTSTAVESAESGGVVTRSRRARKRQISISPCRRPVLASLTMTTPEIADPPAGIHSLWRLRGYLKPHLPALGVMTAAAVAGVGLSITIPLVTKAIIDGPIADGDLGALLPLGLLALGLGILEAVLIWVRRWVQSNAVLGLETRIRHDLYERLQALPMSFH